MKWTGEKGDGVASIEIRWAVKAVKGEKKRRANKNFLFHHIGLAE